MRVQLGNLLPGQSVILKQTIVAKLEVVAGHYAISLPSAFFPDYKKHGLKSKGGPLYPFEFDYQVRILSNSQISQLSVPSHSCIAAQNADRTDITVKCDQPSRSMDLFYRTYDMTIP